MTHMFFERRRRDMKHKNPKKPTLEQKKKIAAAGLKWENWLVKDEDNISLALVNKQSGKIRVILT